MNSYTHNNINIFRYFFEKYKIQTFIVMVGEFLVGILDGIGIAAALPLIALVVQKEQRVETELYSYVEFLIEKFGFDLTLETIIMTLIVIFMVKAGIKYALSLYNAHLSSKIVLDFRRALTGTLLRSRWSFFIACPLGELTNSLILEAARSGGCFRSMINLFSAFVQITVLGYIAYAASWELALFSFGTGALLWFLFHGYIVKSRSAGMRQKDVSKKIMSYISDILQNYKSLKAMGSETPVFKNIDYQIQKIFEITKTQYILKQGLIILYEPVIIIFMCAAMYISIKFLNVEISILMIFTVIIYRFSLAARSMQSSYQTLNEQQSFFWSFQTILQEAREARETFDKVNNLNFKKSIVFENVSFSYGDKPVINNCSFTIPVNSITNIAGSSGTGKTTVIDLLCGLYKTSGGFIKVDGQNLNDLDIKAWRSKIGYVAQEFVVFNDTILNNITLGDAAVSENDVIKALKDAEAWDFVENLPDVLHTQLGEKGARLSGGQRQRVSIARALVRRPSVLILDEAMASLDPQTEKEIWVTLKKLSRNMAVIAISHQNTARRYSDNIINLEPINQK